MAVAEDFGDPQSTLPNTIWLKNGLRLQQTLPLGLTSHLQPV